jgi:hypothetical protein
MCKRNHYALLSSFQTKIVPKDKPAYPISLAPVSLGEMSIACPGHTEWPPPGRCWHPASRGSLPDPSQGHRWRWPFESQVLAVSPPASVSGGNTIIPGKVHPPAKA